MVEVSKRTFLYDEHVKLGAKIVPFAGYDMPVQYSSILLEHKAVREKVGVFDVSHMGEVFVSGKNSLTFLQSIVPQDVSALKEGHAVYCQLTNLNGGIIDDLIIYYLAPNSYLLIINASRVKEDVEWILKNAEKFDELEINNVSDDYSLFALQGPLSSDLMTDFGLNKDNQPEYFSIIKTTLQGVEMFVSRTGYTGEDGFELLVLNEQAKTVWDKLFEIGEKYELKPIGLGARDILRLEAGLLLYGNDMDEETTPIESGLGWSIPRDKKEAYNGCEVIQEQLVNKPSKKLVALKMVDRGIARHGYEIYSGDEQIGVITSGGVSPILNENIALGFVNIPVKIDDEVLVKIRDKFLKAKISKKPFVKKVNKIAN